MFCFPDHGIVDNDAVSHVLFKCVETVMIHQFVLSIHRFEVISWYNWQVYDSFQVICQYCWWTKCCLRWWRHSDCEYCDVYHLPYQLVQDFYPSAVAHWFLNLDPKKNMMSLMKPNSFFWHRFWVWSPTGKFKNSCIWLAIFCEMNTLR